MVKTYLQPESLDWRFSSMMERVQYPRPQSSDAPHIRTLLEGLPQFIRALWHDAEYAGEWAAHRNSPVAADLGVESGRNALVCQFAPLLEVASERIRVAAVFLQEGAPTRWPTEPMPPKSIVMSLVTTEVPFGAIGTNYETVHFTTTGIRTDTWRPFPVPHWSGLPAPSLDLELLAESWPELLKTLRA
jgi:hypothetical protein